MEFLEDEAIRKLDELWYKHVPEARVMDCISKNQYDILKKEIWKLVFDLLEKDINWSQFPSDSDYYLNQEIDYLKTLIDNK